MGAKRRGSAVAPLLLLGAMSAGCTDITFGGVGDDFEGYYDYAGTVDGKVGDVVTGSLRITDQRGSRADVSIDWRYFDDGVQILRITTQRDATADLDHDGRIAFDFEGDLFLDGVTTRFRLSHDGWLDERHHTISGSWRLTTNLPTTDRGAFVARD